MTDKAVSALTSLTGANTATGDLLYIVDISEAAAADRSKKITIQEAFKGVPAGAEATPSLAAQGDQDTGMWFPAANTLAWSTGGIERARLDSSGNLGLGVTPSAWGSGHRALDIGVNSYLSGSTSLTVENNAYFNGTNNIYKNSAAATQYQQTNAGIHTWSIAPSGTAGNAITFTQAMTLDASGNLGIGTSSPATKVHAVGDNVPARGQVSMQTSTAANFAQITFYDRTTLGAQIYQGYQATAGVGDLTIQTAGASSALVFGTNATERARITSGGYFKASNDGTYYGSTGAYHELRQTSATATDATLVLTATNASLTGDIVYARSSRAANTAFRFYVADANGTDQFYVRGDGAIYAQNTTVQSISDARLKENIRNASEGLNVITALRPVRYDWKSGYGNDRKDQLGFIAQEVESVFPEAVSEWKGKEGDETYKTVGPGALIPVLVKAIQEQQAMINELKAEVAALKGV